MDISNFNFVKVNQFEKSPFCVDGRAGTVDGKVYGEYPQMLGGSLMPVVLEWLINRPNENLENILPQVFKKLKIKDYPLGVHTSNHTSRLEKGKSGCGFVDNLESILLIFKEKFKEIEEIISNVGLSFDDQFWKKIKQNLEKINLSILPKGEKLINRAEKLGALKQILIGEHAELVAIINLSKGTTLDVDKQNQKGQQAFNLDLWLVEEIGEKMGWNLELTKALSAGLYVATEIVLVERKGKARLPLLINKLQRLL